MKKVLVCFLFAVLVLQYGVVFADVGEPNEYLDVQGCKIVSEGGYFYIQIKNLRSYTLNVTVDSNIGFADHNGYRIQFPLENGEEKIVHFHAPMIEGEVKTITIAVYLFDQDETVYFPVEVVDNELLKIHENYATAENLKTILFLAIVAVEAMLIAKMKLTKKRVKRKDR